MKRRTFGLGIAATLAIPGCSSKFKAYNGPEVTSVVVNKGARSMFLLHHEEILEQYKFDLGFAPVGDKKIYGDGKTPEGTYRIDRHNPNSSFHLSVGISYPNARDVAEAKAQGKSPGGDIFIHGQPNLLKAKGPDWTAGCIAVKNREIEQIYAMVKRGTLITLRA
ncbi:MAG: murein L,D-transpeptidase YafK [Paracoccaceae bacterium]|jgi:murein L,D-transpeptidase YafK